MWIAWQEPCYASIDLHAVVDFYSTLVNPSIRCKCRKELTTPKTTCDCFQVVSLPFAMSVDACVKLYLLSSSVLMCAISTLPLCASSDVTLSFLACKPPFHVHSISHPSLSIVGLQFCLQLAMATRR